MVVAEYLCTPERTLVFGMRADWRTPRVAEVALDHTGLERFTAITFHAPGGPRMMMQDLGASGLDAWATFSTLLEPLAAWSGPGDVVCLVPHGILHDLPLHTLEVDGAPLVVRNPVFYEPSAAVLLHTLERERRRTGDGVLPPIDTAAMVLGDARSDLPHSRAEAIAVAELLGTRARLADEVIHDTLLNALAGARIVHLAGHGRLAAGDGFASELLLARGGVLLARDLLGVRCAADLVVLSGCETGRSEQRPGDELVGLVRALLLGGVRSVVASQWRADDASTRELLCAFHEAARQDGVTRAEALQRAMIQVRDDPRWAHLYHWGAFVLVGGWR